MTTGAKIAGMAYAAFRKRYLGAHKSGPMKRGPAPALGESVEKKLYDHTKRYALVSMCLPVILTTGAAARGGAQDQDECRLRRDREQV